MAEANVPIGEIDKNDNDSPEVVLFDNYTTASQKIFSSMTPFTRTSPELIWENQKIFQLKSIGYKIINNDSAHHIIDFTHHIETMKSSVEVYGGNTVQAFNEQLDQFFRLNVFNERFDTSIEIANESCLSMAQRYQLISGREVIVMDLAERSANKVCGSWDSYYKGSQEEAIERASIFFRYALDPKFNPILRTKLANYLNDNNEIIYHIPTYGAVVIKNVPIVRDNMMRLSVNWWKVGIVAVGAPDLRLKLFRETDIHNFANLQATDMLKHVFTYRGAPSNLDLLALEESIKRKIKISLVASLTAGYKEIILGALGCGAYRNPTELVARCFADVLKGPPFKGLFKNIGFAVLGEPTFSDFEQNFWSTFNSI